MQLLLFLLQIYVSEDEKKRQDDLEKLQIWNFTKWNIL